jgi:hypothetical protein
MPNTDTRPLGKTPGAARTPADFSIGGLILPIIATSPSDSMFPDGQVYDGMVVVEHVTGDGGGVLWVRIDSTWQPFAST